MSQSLQQLFENREERPRNYAAFLHTITGDTYTAEQITPTIEADVDDLLLDIVENSPLGVLQAYILEEHFLYGRTTEDIESELFEHIDIVNLLASSALRFARNPRVSDDLRRHLKHT